MKELKVHHRLRKTQTAGELVDLVGYVAESDSEEITELRPQLSGGVSYLIPTTAIVEAQQDDDGPATVTVDGSTKIDVVLHSRLAVTAGGLSSGVQGLMGPMRSYIIGYYDPPHNTRPIYLHIGWNGETWHPPSFSGYPA